MGPVAKKTTVIYTAYVVEEFREQLDEPEYTSDPYSFQGGELFDLVDCGVTTNPAKIRGKTSCKDRSWTAAKLKSFYGNSDPPLPGKKVFLVVERYGDGSTFGYRRGLSRPMRFFPSEKLAKEWVASDEADNLKDRDYFGGHEAYKIYPVVVS